MVSLCFTCETKADKVRRDITKLLADYSNTFGIPFKRDDDLYDGLTGAHDDDGGVPRTYARAYDLPRARATE